MQPGFGIKDYISMFDLSLSDFARRILNVQAGLSSFAAEMAAHNHSVIACDPLYAESISHIQKCVESLQLPDYEEWVVSIQKGSEFLEDLTTGSKMFLEDFQKGLKEKRYLGESLPKLSFKNEYFQLALVSHYLFTYSGFLTLEFHINGINELLRVANEVRIFPLVTKEGELSPFVGPVMASLQSRGLGVEIRGVPFELQKNGNAMLRVWNESCTVK